MTVSDFSARLGATPGALAGLRDGLREWLSAAGAGEDERDDITLACWEAAANAVEHPLHDEPTADDAVHVHVRCRSGHVLVCVADTGTWRVRRAPRIDRGLGLTLMVALMDRVRIVRSPQGTRVLMRRSLATHTL